MKISVKYKLIFNRPIIGRLDNSYLCLSFYKVNCKIITSHASIFPNT